MIRLAPVAFVLLVLAVGLSSWAPLDSAPAPAPPTVVTVTSPGDGGLAVMVAFLVGLTLIGWIAAVAFGALWLHERAARRLGQVHGRPPVPERQRAEVTS